MHWLGQRPLSLALRQWQLQRTLAAHSTAHHCPALPVSAHAGAHHERPCAHLAHHGCGYTALMLISQLREIHKVESREERRREQSLLLDVV
jgi:hypothetical protein